LCTGSLARNRKAMLAIIQIAIETPGISGKKYRLFIIVTP
jgi:hypothetical protein